MDQTKHQDLLLAQGYFSTPLVLPVSIREKVFARHWAEVDQLVRKEALPGGAIFEELLNYARFSDIEFIISIRSSIEFPDEDGIWHDDGSRVLAFSLSLTLHTAEIQGGVLEIRKRDGGKGSASSEILTPPYGTMIVFATGVSGFEHKINRVIQGERIIIAGWCT